MFSVFKNSAVQLSSQSLCVLLRGRSMHAQLKDKHSSSYIILRVIFPDFTLSLKSLTLSGFPKTLFKYSHQKLWALFILFCHKFSMSVHVSGGRKSSGKIGKKKRATVFSLLSWKHFSKGEEYFFSKFWLPLSTLLLLSLLPQDCLGARD